MQIKAQVGFCQCGNRKSVNKNQGTDTKEFLTHFLHLRTLTARNLNGN